MHRQCTSLPLSLLLILLIAVNPLLVAAGHAGGDGCCEAAMAHSGVTTYGCCDDHPDQGQQPSCADSFCPAGHCSPLSFMPSPDLPAQSSLPPEHGAIERRGYVSHLSTPSIPPPIVRRLG